MGKNRENKKCRRSVPFRDCRFPQAGTYGKNLPFGKLTNEFAPSITAQKKREQGCRRSVPFRDCRFPQAGAYGKNLPFGKLTNEFAPSITAPKEKRTRRALFSFLLVPLVGVEPTRYRYHGILSPARLPIPPQRLIPRQTNYCIER